MIQHGFDIWLDQVESQRVYDGLRNSAEIMLGSLGLECISLKTNFHELRVEWLDAWGSQLICGLSLLAARYDTVLVANDRAYDVLVPWAHHPLTSPFLGSRGFSVIDDGGDYNRPEKVALIANWREATQHLRVCFGLEVPGQHENCGHCEKCTRTILAFRIARQPLPEAFPNDVTDEQIRSTRLGSTNYIRWEELQIGARKAGLGDTSWAKAIDAALRMRKWRVTRVSLLRPLTPIRNAVRQLVRGSPLSQSQLAASKRAGN